MVNFDQNHRKKPPKNYLARREQWRLLLLIMTFGFVILAMNEARKPHNWDWMFGEQAFQDDAADGSDYDYDYNTTYRPKIEEPEPVGTVRIVPYVETIDEGDSRKYFPGVEPKYIRQIKDNTPFRPAEGKAWYQLLNILQSNTSEFINRSSSGEKSFAQLFRQPNSYRAELVSIRGTVRRATPFEAAKNPYGIEGYTQLIIQPNRGPLHPFIVYTLQLPEEFPRGDEIQEEVELVGFFFKKWVYRAKSSTQIAPLLLARDITWHEEVVVESAALPVLKIVGVVAAMALFGVGVAALIYFQNRRVVSQDTARIVSSAEEAGFQKLAEQVSLAKAASETSDFPSPTDT